MGFKEDFPDFQVHMYSNESFKIDRHFASGKPEHEVRTIQKDIGEALKCSHIVVYLGSKTVNRVQYNNISYEMRHYPIKGYFSNGYNTPMTSAANKKLEAEYGQELEIWINNNIEKLRVQDVAKYIGKRHEELNCMEAKIQAMREAMAAVLC